jgi:Short C-terminal domain
MGFFDRIRHPVQGTATVTAATSPEGMRSPQEVRMTLTVQGIGFDPFTIEHEEKCHTDKWPTPGAHLPVVFDENHRERLEVQWDDVRPGEASTPPPAAPQPAPSAPPPQQQDVHTVTWTSGEEIPPEAKGLFDEVFKAFPDAQVTSHTETNVVDLTNDPEARARMLGPLEEATGMDLDGDGRVGGGSVPPPAAPTPPRPPSMSDDTVSRLERLAALHHQGVLTDEEFAQQKAKLLGS